MKIVYVFLVILALGVLSTVGFLTYKDATKPKLKTAQIESKNDSSAPQTDTSKSTLGVSDEASISQQTIPLGQNETKKQNNNVQILDPSQFTQYESYKTSAEMLLIDIKKGTGADVVSGKKVAVLYKGWLTDGTVFDQSKMNENNELQPFIFALGAGQVISGWEQGIIGMKVGGTRRLVLPPQAGYGSQGQGAIPPDSVLIFDIQLLEVEP